MDIKDQYKKVFQYCYSRIADRDTAEDITQETFLRFLEHPEYQKSGNEIQYLYTIARNLCIDEYRKVPVETLSDEAENIPEQSAGERGWIDSIVLRKILDGLPKEEREIIILRYVSELSVSEIAGIYQTSWFTMNRRIKRILEKLRKLFEEEGLE
ncbi:MAG: RNA polymerase sigma factor [Oscillospiraceae bacterium]